MSELPYAHFNSPASQWDALPSFVIGEWLFIICAIVALVHARREGRDHVLVWVAALIAGTANDMFFMALPLVDTFWQAQGQIMITARLPLYIPCVYVCFMYYPTVAVRRLGLPSLSQAALTGMVGCLFYAPYDITGAKFLWWTWHDTDVPSAIRLLGAPVASSLWTLLFTASFAWLIGKALGQRRGDEITTKVFAIGFALVAGCTTLLMLVQITILQQVDGGAPGYGALAAGWIVYATIVGIGIKRAKPESPRPGDRLLLGAAIAYFTVLIGIMACFDPATHVSTGVHQTAGECYVEATDITGFTRHEFLCASDFDEDYSFECADALPGQDGTSPTTSEWYTICGRPHSNFTAWMGGVTLLGFVGIGLFTFMLSPARFARGPAARAALRAGEH
jgi:hypothetical protein